MFAGSRPISAILKEMWVFKKYISSEINNYKTEFYRTDLKHSSHGSRSYLTEIEYNFTIQTKT